MFNILTIDGGGVRGILPVILIERIRKERPEFLNKINMFAGCSTGGIIALALGLGIDPKELDSLYTNKSVEIFDKSRRWLINRPFRSKYDNENLKKQLFQLFGFAKIRELKTRVVIPTFSLNRRIVEKMVGPRCAVQLGNNYRWMPRVFDSANTDCQDELIKEVALYTCSAPTYFKAENSYIDGGVYANNPSTLALAATMAHMDNAESGSDKIKSINLLSLGTGRNSKRINDANYDAGYAWLFSILDIMLDGVNDVSDAQCEQFLGNNYMRIQPDLACESAMDDTSVIPYVSKLAKYLNIEKLLGWLDGTFLQ